MPAVRDHLPVPTPQLEETNRSRLRRKAERGSHDRAVIDAVLDAGLICHVGFAVDGQPWVFPTAYARVDDQVYVHGAVGNSFLRSLASGVEACLTVTLVDGLVLARSAFHHSMNYRSVMLFGRPEAVSDAEEKRRATLAIVEHMVPGRSADAREPTESELRATLVVRMPVSEGSAKVRRGGPVDDDGDMDLPHWAGQVPLRISALAPVADAPPGSVARPVPDYVRDWVSASERGQVVSS